MSTITNAVESILSAIADLESQGELTDPETEALAVLRACYEMLARTIIVESIIETETVPRAPRFPHSGPNTKEEFIYRLVSGMGDISFRTLLIAMVREREVGPKPLTRLKIVESVGISRDSISTFTRNKNAMNSDNLEKVINYILKTQ